jgi:hypothetical protein
MSLREHIAMTVTLRLVANCIARPHAHVFLINFQDFDAGRVELETGTGSKV